MSIASFAKRAARTVDNNAPMILTSFGVMGLVTSVVLAVRATPVAVRRVENFKAIREAQYMNSAVEDNMVPPADLTKLDVVRLNWDLYIPAVGMTLVTGACIIGAQSINSKRQAAIMTGYSLAEGAFREYREKVAEQLGVKAEEKVRDSVAADQVAANPVSREVIIVGTGDVLCFDSLSGRYFNSDMETIRRAQNDLNQTILHDMYASQNDFYSMVGLAPTPLGNELGWNTDVMLEIKFSTTMTDDNRPAISLNYSLAPVRDYYKFG